MKDDGTNIQREVDEAVILEERLHRPDNIGKAYDHGEGVGGRRGEEGEERRGEATGLHCDGII